MDQIVERGKPADYGQELIRRRARITTSFLSLRGRNILDFGSGNGAQTIELAKRGCRIVACDIDAVDLAVLSDYVTAHKIHNVTPTLYDGVNVPAADATFDAAVSYAVLEHVNDEAHALAEIHRVLKDGAEFLIAVPNKWWIFETHGARLPLLPWNRVPFFSWLPGPIHGRFARARIYTRKGITALLKRNGFEVLRTCYMTAPIDVVKSPALKSFLRKTIFRRDVTGLPVLATEIFVLCRRIST